MDASGSRYEKAAFYMALLSFAYFLIVSNETYSSSLAYNALSVLYIAAGFIYFIIYGLIASGKQLTGIDGKNVRLILPIILTIAFVILFSFHAKIASVYTIIKGLGYAREFGIYLLFLIPTFACSAFGAYFIFAKKQIRLGLFLLAIAFLISIIFFIYIVKSFQVGDETIISALDVKSILMQQNPYAESFAKYIYSNFSTAGGTLTMNNEVIGKTNYPALYFIVAVPFYLFSLPTIYNISHIGVKIEVSIFIFLLVSGIAILLNEKKLRGFDFGFIAMFVFMLSTVTSPVDYLVLLFLVISYVKLDSQYSFIPLGIAASLQEEAWIPIILMLVYALNREGLLKGMKKAAGAVAVFLLINSVFIIANPRAYFDAVFAPIGNLFPFGIPPTGSLMLFGYHVPIDAAVFAFSMFTILSITLLLFFDRKVLVPFLSLMPMMVLFHTLGKYYTFFLFFGAFALAAVKKEKQDRGLITRYLHRNIGVFYLALLIIVMVFVIGIYLYHMQYLSNFDVRITNQSISYIGNNTIYDAQLHYSNMTNGTVYLYLQGYSNYTMVYGIYGINNSLIGTHPECNDSYTCYVNYNRINLVGKDGIYDVHAVIEGQHVTDRATRLHAMIYDTKYVYYSDDVVNESAYVK